VLGAVLGVVEVAVLGAVDPGEVVVPPLAAHAAPAPMPAAIDRAATR
jgi:hypothetical protein